MIRGDQAKVSMAVDVTPDDAFRIFTEEIDRWWRRGLEYRVSGKNRGILHLEPRVGGRLFESIETAKGTHVVESGTVLAWEPPSRLLLAWQISSQWVYDPALLTELELTFSPAAGGGTLITLEHRNLERFGRDAARHAERLNGGWPTKLDTFAAYADTGATVSREAGCPTSSS